MRILVTGSAGFIGSNLVLRLLDSKEPVTIVGFDNLNDYYDPSLKEYRLGLIDAKTTQRPELDKTEYTVGEYYTKDNKSLKNV